MSTRDIYPVLITGDDAATIERTLESLAEFPEVKHIKRYADKAVAGENRDLPR